MAKAIITIQDKVPTAKDRGNLDITLDFDPVLKTDAETCTDAQIFAIKLLEKTMQLCREEAEDA